jgi:carboxypeptidase C (cathepsin A)
MYLNGIVLISSVLNFQTIDFNVGNDLPFPLYLPSYTATAWYHKKLAPELLADFAAAIRESEQFASHEYMLALMKGSGLSDAERKSVVAKLARLTGLSPAFIEQNDLRITLAKFDRELLRAERRRVGRLDSRFAGIERTAGPGIGADPSYSAIYGPYSGTLNDFVRTELKYENDLPYEILTGRVRPWNYGTAQNRYVNVGETLRNAISQNANLRVLVAAGYYDCATRSMRPSTPSRTSASIPRSRKTSGSSTTSRVTWSTSTSRRS